MLLNSEINRNEIKDLQMGELRQSSGKLVDLQFKLRGKEIIKNSK